MSEGSASTEAPLALAFFDPDRRLHGIARSGMTLLFQGATPSVVGGGPEVEASDGGLRATLGDRLELAFEFVAEPVELAGQEVRVCSVKGTADRSRVDCIGTATRTLLPPQWDDLDALRTISALFDPGHAVLVVARRPRGAPGHGRELVSATMLIGGELRSVEEARVSTVYDGDGRQRSAGLELWMPGEDFPRRAAGEVAAGTTLELAGLRVNASVFAWRMEGREGAGAYEVTVRSEAPEAA